MNTKRYSFKKGLGKMIKSFVFFAIPVLIDQFIVYYPQIAQLTVGAILVGIANYLKIKRSSA